MTLDFRSDRDLRRFERAWHARPGPAAQRIAGRDQPLQHLPPPWPAARSDRQSGPRRHGSSREPVPDKDLYFVADGTGGHVFAPNLAEHNRNVARWRKIEADRAREAEEPLPRRRKPLPKAARKEGEKPAGETPAGAAPEMRPRRQQGALSYPDYLPDLPGVCCHAGRRRRLQPGLTPPKSQRI